MAGRGAHSLYRKPWSMHFLRVTDTLQKTFFINNHIWGLELGLISLISNPKGENRTLRIRIRRRLCFSSTLASLYRMFFRQNHTFYFELDHISFISNPKGGNRTLRTRIHQRYCFSSPLASFHKMFFRQNIPFLLN